jgi:hypothetical protein
MRHLALAILLVGCGCGSGGGGHVQPDATAPGADSPAASDAPGADTPAIADAPAGDAPATPDAAPDAPAGVITGGPCISGATGATAYRVRWADAGGTAQVVYEVNGLPDHSRDHTGAFGQIGFTPRFVDPFLGDGGLQLDGSDFVDIELTTNGVASIASATLSIFGRSFNTTASGSFNWQTFVDVGSTPTNFVSNVAPYRWYSADMTSALAAGDANTLIRIKAGPASGVLVVNRIEICVVAD